VVYVGITLEYSSKPTLVVMITELFSPIICSLVDIMYYRENDENDTVESVEPVDYFVEMSFIT